MSNPTESYRPSPCGTYYVDGDGFALPDASGWRDEGDDGGLSWAVYPRAAWDDGYVYVPPHHNGLAGRWFWHEANVRVGRNRVLVTQRRGLDV